MIHQPLDRRSVFVVRNGHPVKFMFVIEHATGKVWRLQPISLTELNELRVAYPDLKDAPIQNGGEG